MPVLSPVLTRRLCLAMAWSLGILALAQGPEPDTGPLVATQPLGEGLVGQDLAADDNAGDLQLARIRARKPPRVRPPEGLAHGALSDINFNKSLMAGLHLRERILSRSHFVEANLQGAYLLGARLDGCLFEGANLCRADLRQAVFPVWPDGPVCFPRANLQEARLSQTAWPFARFTGADLRKADLREANFLATFLAGADLRGARVNGVQWFGVADLAGADLSGLDLTGADLTGAPLEGAKLVECTLQNVILEKACLRSGNLRQANLREGRLGQADLRNADLRGCDLRDADLSDCDLGGADLRDADLRGARLVRANLSEARLDNLRWDGADCRRADFSRARFWPDRITALNTSLVSYSLAGTAGSCPASAAVLPLEAEAAQSPLSEPGSIVQMADGSVWSTMPGQDRIDRLDPATGTTSHLLLAAPHRGPGHLLAGVDGQLWFAARKDGRICRLSLHDNQLDSWQVCGANSELLDLKAGPWGVAFSFGAEEVSCGLLSIQNGTARIQSLPPVPVPAEATVGRARFQIAAGRDGSLWALTQKKSLVRWCAEQNLWQTFEGIRGDGPLVPREDGGVWLKDDEFWQEVHPGMPANRHLGLELGPVQDDPRLIAQCDNRGVLWYFHPDFGLKRRAPEGWAPRDGSLAVPPQVTSMTLGRDNSLWFRMPGRIIHLQPALEMATTSFQETRWIDGTLRNQPPLPFRVAPWPR